MNGSRPDLSERLDALARAVDLGRDRCEPPLLAPAQDVIARASARTRLSPYRTVVALAGGTGSGKSTLFNALAGHELAVTGVRRPTTSRARAAIWPLETASGGGTADASPLLDWLDVRDRHVLSASPPVADEERLDGLVLIDLPDFDSTEAPHRIEAERLTAVVDLLVWVLDPQKYADAAVHERYLRPLATHRDVTLVVLNQIDRLDPASAAGCMRHLRALLAADGLTGVPLLATSARRGDGLAQLRADIAGRVRARAAAVQRLHADVDAAVAALAPLCAGSATGALGRRAAKMGAERGAERSAAAGDDALVAALAEAAGVPTVAAAAGASYRQRAVVAAGWPPTRWLTRLRPNPLRRLHLGPGSSGVTSVPAATGAQRAQVSNALREIVADRAGGVPEPWRRSVSSVVEGRQQALTGELDAALRGADLSAADRPRWWSGVRAVQRVLVLVALAGALWLAVLAGLFYLRLPTPVPHVGRAPIPTLLLVGGLGLGLLLSLAVRPCIAVGAGRRRARAQRSLDAGVRAVAQRSVLAPLAAELDTAAQFCAAVHAAGPADVGARAG